MSDSFSKKILSWDCSDKVCPKLRVQTFKDALSNAMQSFGVATTITLVVDGGVENVNHFVSEFEQSVKDVLKKVIHLTDDFAHSNSAVEALNKIIQNNYLSKMCIENGIQLIKVLKMIVEEYNNKRPHGGLNGCTPNEVYSAVTPSFPTDEEIAIQKLRRRTSNKGSCCAFTKITDNKMFLIS